MKKWLLILIPALVVAGIIGYRMYNQEHADTSRANADVALTPQELLAAYETEENEANAKYLDKLIEVEGTVSGINSPEKGSSLTLDTGNPLAAILCEFEDANATGGIKAGDKVKVKGYCTGKLDDIVLARCAFIESKK